MESFISEFMQGATLISEKLLSWLEGFFIMIPNIVLSVVVMISFVFISRVAKRLVKKALLRTLESPALISLTGTICQMLILIGGFLIALNLLDLQKTVTSILAGAGVIGLALGFAFQETAANFISGVFLALRKPINVGDIVQVNDSEMGEVVNINLRTTVLNTFQGQSLIVPNKEVFQNQIKNYSTGERRIDLACGVSYGDNLEKVQRIATEAIEAMGIHKSDTEVQLVFEEFGDSSINFNLMFWIDYPAQPDYLSARSKAIIALKQAFDENDISIPFPIRTLDFGIKGGQPLQQELGHLRKVESN